MGLSSIIIAIIGALFGTGGLLHAFLQRRKTKAEADSKVITNGHQVVNLYKDALDDLSVRYEKKYKELEAMYDQKAKLLSEENKIYKRQVSTLKKENLELRKKLKILEENTTL